MCTLDAEVFGNFYTNLQFSTYYFHGKQKTSKQKSSMKMLKIYSAYAVIK